MNKLIFRKLYFDIFAFFLLSSLAITSIVWVAQGVNLLDIVSEQGHSFKVYLFYSILNIPKIFAKLIIFAYFLSLFVVLTRYEENNEILVFWMNGIKKISFINFICKISILFTIIQLFFNLFVVPYTQNLAQDYLKNSSLDLFPKLIKEKKFSNVMKNLTIFVDEYKENGILNGIYIKEKIDEETNKIIIADKGRVNETSIGYNFELFNGEIINIDKKGNFNLGFVETIYELSKLDTKTRKEKKLGETKSSLLIYCVNSNLQSRKDKKLRCGRNDSFLLKDIYEEIFKRVINPLYIIILSLISTITILKSNVLKFHNLFKFILFISGFTIIIFSELSYKFINSTLKIEILFIILPFILIFFFYLYILIRTNFKPSYL